MCGRFTLTAELKKVADRFGAAPLPDWGSRPPDLKTTPGHLSSTLGPRYNIAPSQSVIVVGDRMPVILTRDTEAAWLNPNIQETEKLLPLLKQFPSDEIEFYPVSREVNSPQIDNPSNIEPINILPSDQ